MSAWARSAVEIVELFPARRRDRRAFVELPFTLAADIEAWQPGVRMIHDALVHPGRNPFWKARSGSFFAAMRGGQMVGRVAVIDPGGVPERLDAAVLAFPDFTDDGEVTGRLFDAAEARARERGALELVGPMNPNVHHDVGVLVHGHEHRNAIFMGFQPPYYREHFEARGFEGLADFQAWGLYRDTFLAEGRLKKLVDRVERRPELTIRPVDLKRFDQELRLLFRLYSEAFADHWGFTAPSWDEFTFLAGDLRHVLRPTMSLVAEWKGEPVGFVLGVPDLYGIIPKATRGRMTPRFFLEMLLKWRRVDEARVMIAGVLPPYRRYGVHLPLFYRVARAIFDLGFRGGEISWVMADNEAMVKALRLLGAHHTKTYRLYRKALHQ